ncbi:hypothetical protein ADUPG1_002514, partial [Aduncisulcus paluster]
RKQTYSDEWRRYSAILTQKGRTDVKRLFNAFWIECLEEGRASGIRPPQTATGTSSEQNQSEQGVAAPVQPQHSHWQNMKDVLRERKSFRTKRRSKRKTPYPITTYSVSEKRSADSVGKRRKLTPEEEEERAWGEPDVLFIEKREIKPRQPSDGLSESERQKRLKNWIGDSEKEEKDIYYQLEQKQLAENRAREEELRKTKPKRMSMQTYKSLVTEAEKEITGTDKTIDGDEIVENDDEKPDDI